MSSILIVDDLPANREFLVTLLGLHGHELLQASNGSEGLGVVRTAHPDLVITDVLMPVMDGYEFVRQLRLNPATSRTPVVFYTAHYGAREARALALASGVSDVLTKPAVPAEVLRIVDRALSGESGAASPAATATPRAELDREHLRLLTDTLSDKVGDLRVANARLRALINIGLELASERDADRLLKSVCVAARDLFGATYVTLGILDRHDRVVHRFLTCGTDATCAVSTADWIKTGDAVSGMLHTVVAERRTLRGHNSGGDPATLQLPVLHPEVHDYLAAPIASPAQAYGWICLVGNEGRPFTDDDEQLLIALSGQVGRIYEIEGEILERTQAVEALKAAITERRTLEAQYQQAQKMEAIGQLAGGVAHDFNNLLTAILGYCELLLDDLGANDRHRADIAEIQKAGMSAAGLTRQLLAFSRKQIIEPTLLNLNEVVADMRTMLERLIAEDVKVVLNLRPELSLVKADRGQMEQIVMNLSVNARDAMPKGGTLTIETANAGAEAVLTVTDTGTGMTPEVQARLFEPFFTTKELGRGTGLGLATVHGIVTRSDGRVEVSSEVGRGSTFRLSFPIAAAEEIVVKASLAAKPRAGAQTVLLVEDAAGLREMTRRLLERLGYTVLVAANADEALRQFDEHASIDVVLTDVVMPGASGPALTRQLVAQRPALKVIYMSGYTDDAIVQHGMLNPGIAFLQKPFTSETLGRKIREALER